VTYLLVPDFHERHLLTTDPGFATWCAQSRPFDVEWALHGYSHSDRRSRRAS
jgi:predicted deacetylase